MILLSALPHLSPQVPAWRCCWQVFCSVPDAREHLVTVHMFTQGQARLVLRWLEGKE